MDSMPHPPYNPLPPPPPNSHLSGTIVIMALIILVIIIVFIGVFRVYAHLCRRHRRPLVVSWRRNPDKPSGGLDKVIINSLPTFTYKTQLPRSADLEAGLPECAVCLIEFQENDACRFLPKCSHSFHTECIDMWFLSNTTCPMCRTTAEMVDAENRCCAESMSTSLLPHEDLTDQTQRSDSSLYCQELSTRAQRLRSRSTTCLPLNQDITIQIQRTRSIGHFSSERDEGLGLHMRQMLARTFSSKANCGRFDMVRQEMHNRTHSINTMMGIMPHDGSIADGDGQMDHPLRSPSSEVLIENAHLRNWQRSAVPDRFHNMGQGTEYPTNVLLCVNDLHVMPHPCKEHWQVGGRSLPHLSFLASQDSFSPRGLSASSSPSLCLATGEQRPPPPRAFPSVSHHQQSQVDSLTMYDSVEETAGH